jgi:methyltransferase-like protein/ubiquinone/menaquinone biosynthesis C-methylase UbiE
MITYDELRYPGRFYPQASIERMATLATLYGLESPSVQGCRVLELGCGEGGHLIPLAYVFSQSEFLGVDLSEVSVGRAKDVAVKLGLKNLQFKTEDLGAFPANAGIFDYIIAHGVFSWIPPAIQEKLLEICSRHLAPEGVAYVSYNTYPAGHLRRIPRDLARFHTRHISEPRAKAQETRAILDFVISALPEGSMQRELLRRESAAYLQSEPLLVFDLLSENNEPMYFLDFIDQAAEYGLQYIAESDVQKMRTPHLPEHARKQLDAVSDRLLREQYLDFILGRGFRQTLLCRAGHDLDLAVTPQRMERLLVASSLKPQKPIENLHSGEAVEFRDAQGTTVSTSEPLPKAVYSVLGMAYPHALCYSDLRARACVQSGMELPLDSATEAKLIRTLVSSFANGVIEFHVYEAPFHSKVSDRPLASLVARYQATTDLPVSSMRLASFAMPDPALRLLLPLLDASRDHQALLTELRAQLPASASEGFDAEKLKTMLGTLAEYGILIG